MNHVTSYKCSSGVLTWIQWYRNWASVDLVVGLGSSVIDFSLNKKGSGYGDNIKLTVGVGGTVGIPTFSTHTDFEIEVVRTQRDDFNGWYVGELESL